MREGRDVTMEERRIHREEEGWRVVEGCQRVGGRPEGRPRGGSPDFAGEEVRRSSPERRRSPDGMEE
jgi:hypothetical protein